MSDILYKLKKVLREKLNVVHIDIQDLSDQHRRHKESIASGGGHFHVTITGACFEGETQIARHRMVYKAVQSLQEHIHALSIRAYTPDEYESMTNDKGQNPNVK